MTTFPTPTIPDALSPWADIIQATLRPALQLTRHPEPPSASWQSCLAGLPYWPADMDYPRQDDGQLMPFLLQINFAEIPPLPDFPQQGILQLFLNDDYTEGVIARYFPDISTDPALLIDAADYWLFLRSAVYPFQEPDPLPGITRPGRLAFVPITVPPDVTDYEFAEHFADDPALTHSPVYTQPHKTHKDRVRHDELFRQSPYNQYRQLTEPGLCSTLGGYARFPQHNDPRQPGQDWPNGLPPTEKRWIPLLKLMSDPDFGMNWGDCQEWHVFIRRDALLRADFSNLWTVLAS